MRGLGERLSEYYGRYRVYRLPQTDAPREYGFDYLSCLMRLETKRTMARRGRTSGVPRPNLPQVIGDSPWGAPPRISAPPREISVRPAYAARRVCLIDERAAAKAGRSCAGGGRQPNRRLGKVAIERL